MAPHPYDPAYNPSRRRKGRVAFDYVMWRNIDMDLHKEGRKVVMRDLSLPDEAARPSRFRGMISVMALAALTKTHDAAAQQRDQDEAKHGAEHIPFERPTAQQIEAFFNSKWVQ